MNESNPASFQYSLGEEYQARTITSLPNQRRHIFAAGTHSLNYPNKIHIIELDNDQRVQQLQVFTHPGLIEQLIPDPLLQTQLYVIASEANQKKISLVSSNYEENEQPRIIFDLVIERKLQSLIPSNKEPKLYLCDEKSINTYDLNTQSFMTLLESQEVGYTLSEMDPHHNNLFCRVFNGNVIHILDTREKKVVSSIENAHDLNITDLDFNPNKQYYFVSAGEDCAIKFWDLRKPQYSMKILDEFHNSALSAKYNRFHDQLLSIAFDDGSIVLYRATSVSSVPQISQINYQASSKEEDGVVRVYDEHEDSACQIAWSYSTAWVFASIGYNSSIVINTVPIAEKYKILL